MKNYKEKYEEALERANQAIKECGYNQGRIKMIESIFPELAESEDERIRKSIIDLVEKQMPKSENKKWMLAWLEKQGEQKPIISDDAIREGVAHFGITQYQITNWLKKYVDVKKQGEQKPAEILLTLDEAIAHCKEKSCGNSACASQHQQLAQWLTELKEYKEQKPAEWSEEDEEIIEGLNNCLDELEERNGWHYTYVNDKDVELSKIRNWCKSLKPQPHWKPSEEQMRTLEYYMNALNCNEHKEILFGLYKQLKSLKQRMKGE